jgi:hypothetical protein
LILLVHGRWEPSQIIQRHRNIWLQPRRGSLLVLGALLRNIPSKSLSIPMHLEQAREGVLHEQDGLVLHHLIVLSRLCGLPVIASNDVE